MEPAKRLDAGQSYPVPRRCSKHLDVLIELRVPAKAAMLAEAKKQAAWKILRSIPYLGPIRVAEIMAIMEDRP